MVQEMTLPKLVWKASPNVSSRHGHAVTRLVLHDCQGSYAGSIETFLGNNNGNPVSAHFVVNGDGSEATQMVDLAEKAWHACNANPYSIGLEMAGYAERGFSDAELDTSAAIFAFLCHRLNIPVKHASGLYDPGISSHFDLGKFGGGHADPSVRPAFMPAFVTRVAAVKDIPAEWPGLHDSASHAPPAPKPAPSELLTVTGLQAALNVLGAHIKVDGVSGPETWGAILAFQGRAGLKKDGIAGPITDAAIRKALHG